MRKGLVVEIKDAYFIVMEPSGKYKRLVKRDGIEIGQKIFFAEEDIYSIAVDTGRQIPLWTKVGILAAAVLLIFVSTLFNSRPFEEYAVVSLDVNPSIEFVLDDQEKIIKVVELNKDASRLKLGNLKGEDFDNGLKLLEQELKAKGYLQPKGAVLVGVNIPEDEQGKVHEKHIKEIVKTNFSDSKILYIKGTEQDRQMAKKKNISLGRYEASKQLERESDDEWMKEAEVEQIIRNILSNPAINVDEIGEYIEEDKLVKEDKSAKVDDEVKETLAPVIPNNTPPKDNNVSNNTMKKEESSSNSLENKKDNDNDNDDKEDEDRDKNEIKENDDEDDREDDRDSDKEKDKEKDK
ncbi:MAG: anti-sigma factor domain-containing protein, partial [Cellulosilyticaceae bacterium]